MLLKFPGEKFEPIKKWQNVRVVGPGEQWVVQWHETLSLYIPCQRVVRSDLNLGNYGGGVEMKRELLKKEGVKIEGLRVVRP